MSFVAYCELEKNVILSLTVYKKTSSQDEQKWCVYNNNDNKNDNKEPDAESNDEKKKSLKKGNIWAMVSKPHRFDIFIFKPTARGNNNLKRLSLASYPLSSTPWLKNKSENTVNTQFFFF